MQELIRQFWMSFVSQQRVLLKLPPAAAADKIEFMLGELAETLDVEVADISGTREMCLLDIDGKSGLAAQIAYPAPDLGNLWKLVVDRPPLGFDFTISTGFAKVRASSLRFEILSIATSSGERDVRIFFPRPFTVDESSEFLARRIVRTGIGTKLYSCIRGVECRVLDDHHRGFSVTDMVRHIEIGQ